MGQDIVIDEIYSNNQKPHQLQDPGHLIVHHPAKPESLTSASNLVIESPKQVIKDKWQKPRLTNMNN